MTGDLARMTRVVSHVNAAIAAGEADELARDPDLTCPTCDAWEDFRSSTPCPRHH